VRDCPLEDARAWLAYGVPRGHPHHQQGDHPRPGHCDHRQGAPRLL